MTSNMLPLKKSIKFLVVVYPREWFYMVSVPFFAPHNQVLVKSG
jgi:hypothetical protein